MISRRKTLQGLAGASLLGHSLLANANPNYPERPVRLVVAKPPGGLDDRVARAIHVEVEKVLRQPLVIENIAGGQGIIGTQNLIRAQPDGYKIMLLNTKQQITAGAVMEKTPYDLTKDVTPIIAFASYRSAIIAHTSMAGTFQDMLRFAKSNPGKVLYASAGVGTTGHLILAVAAQQAGADMLHVPYQGGGPASAAIMAGQAHLFYSDMTTALHAARTGRARIVAQSGTTRYREAPDAPLFSELGYNQFSNGSISLVGPAGMDPAVVEKIQAAVRQACAQPALIELLQNVGVEVDLVNGAGLRKEIEDTAAQWGPQAKAVLASAGK
ncbi:Bug family tripartite tricarboxylate transporter substrate binding protein [Hydrogenophaga sp. BPS33]|uniref:Bug family tripartite tricarboxylate transporter substrate binding protein n=1 Tax=Hydrogenophaga sp. BPS33 TaxID=2651974 RepID=UPI00131F7B49|nr:tripartite tricarboxylate transporter substrate binding protein [Hydrogenophaga sp. BPS33]QHE88554.1 tripartite tricarboxylate transporter substrate binding protein [Hydrogenophaga sp. BPS33]